MGSGKAPPPESEDVNRVTDESDWGETVLMEGSVERIQVVE